MMTKLFAPHWQDKYLPLLVLIAVFLLIKLPILFFGAGNLMWDQETNVGTLSKMLIDGVSPAFIFYNLDNYRLGGFIAAVFTAPFFILFGKSLIVLRAVAMFVSLGTLVLTYLFLRKFFSKAAAILACLFLILAPWNYAKASFVVSGGYMEVNFFFVLAIFLFYKIFFSQAAPRWHFYAFWGAASGFATCYDYTFLLTLSCCLLFWFSFDKWFLLKKNFHVSALFFLMGSSPWFYYNLTHDWNAVFIMRERSLLAWFSMNGFLGSLIQLKNLIISDIPGFFAKSGSPSFTTRFIAPVYYSIFLFSFCGLFWLERRSVGTFLNGLISPPRRHADVAGSHISRETFLIVFVMMFCLAYAFCGVTYLPAVEADLVFPYRFILFVMPSLFMIAALFLVRLYGSNKYGAVLSKALGSVLIAAGLISNIGMISLQDMRLSALPEGYNYIFFGKQLRYLYGDDMGPTEDVIHAIDRKYQRFFYEGYRWSVPESAGFSVNEYARTKLSRIDKEFWPFAYENLGKTIGRNEEYSKNIDEEFKSNTDKLFYPYFYIGLGRTFIAQGLDETEYRRILGIIDEPYKRYFREGIGIEMDIMFIEHPAQFSEFMSRLDTEAKTDIYRGFASGREYPRISYRSFQIGFGKIGRSMDEWVRRVSLIDEEFRPYCYRRLALEIGWRLTYGVKENLDFLKKADVKYAAQVYGGLGTSIGWRFGDNMKGCMLLIRQTDPRYWRYLYEGLGTGVAKRYGYQFDERFLDAEAEKIPAGYRDLFRKGFREAGDI